MTARTEREAGFTIVEVVVAALVVTMGAIATFGMLSAATKNTYRAKQSQVAADIAQQELEALRGLTSKEVALTAAPAHSTNTKSPNYRVSNGTFAMQQSPPSEYRNLVVNGGSIYGKNGEGGSEVETISGGVIEPGPTKFTSGDVSGSIYRYVVWRNDESCSEASCPGTQDYKQVVVAVKMSQPGLLSAQRGYVEVQSDFIDPTDSKARDPLAGAGGTVVTAQQFYLTDTPCSTGAFTERQEITGDHLLHNTLGTCASGPQTGSTKGSPDALLTGAPPDSEEGIPPMYDYSNDSYLETPKAETDKGLQLRKDDSPGCHYVPSGVVTPQSQVHRWVTDPFAKNFKMTKNVTLEFYTRTLSDEPYTGELCVYLFKRHEVGTPPVATDTLLVNSATKAAYWTYLPQQKAQPYWPQFKWERIRVTMSFIGAPYTIPAGDRLGVALSMERSETGGDGVSIMYDNPATPTRLEVDTDTPIDGG
jgi:type II secretory pathway pseudopilin PulG